jgi:hypothetical protein
VEVLTARRLNRALLAHARRAQILPEEVFNTKMPQSIGTFTVAGTWRFTGGRVVAEPFTPLAARVKREVSEEAERLTEFHR